LSNLTENWKPSCFMDRHTDRWTAIQTDRQTWRSRFSEFCECA